MALADEIEAWWREQGKEVPPVAPTTGRPCTSRGHAGPCMTLSTNEKVSLRSLLAVLNHERNKPMDNEQLLRDSAASLCCDLTDGRPIPDGRPAN